MNDHTWHLICPLFWLGISEPGERGILNNLNLLMEA